MCASNSRVYLNLWDNESIGILEHDFSLTKVKCYQKGKSAFFALVLFIWSEDDILFIAGYRYISVFKVASSKIISQTNIGYDIPAMQRLDNDHIFVLTFD